MTTWVANPRVLNRRLPDGVLLLAVSGGDPAFLQGTAEELWDLLVAPITLDALAETMADRHGVTAAVVRADLRDALDDLTARGLVLREPPDPHPGAGDPTP